MARTNSQPGPKPRYGKRRDYHMLLSAEPVPGQAMSLADAFEQAAKAYEVAMRQQAEARGEKQRENNGIIAYIEFVIKARPEIRERLSGSSSHSE